MKYEIGSKLRYYRENRGLNQKEFASKIGVSNSRVSNWEQGINRPDADMLLIICKVLNISADELLGITFSNNDMTKNDYAPAEQGQDLTDDEHELLTNFRASSVDGRRMILNYSECIRFAGGSLYSVEEQEKLSSAFHNAAGTKKPG